jgi:hypothetical protein
MSTALRRSGVLAGSAATAFRSDFIGMRVRICRYIGDLAFEPAILSLGGFLGLVLSLEFLVRCRTLVAGQAATIPTTSRRILGRTEMASTHIVI